MTYKDDDDWIRSWELLVSVGADRSVSGLINSGRSGALAAEAASSSPVGHRSELRYQRRILRIQTEFVRAQFRERPAI